MGRKIKFGILLSIFLLVGISIGMLITQTEITTGIKVANSRDYVPEVLKEIQGADKSIHVSVYSTDYYIKYPDSEANKLLSALGDAHDNGLDVRVIVDEFPKSADGFTYLTEKGVPVRYDGKSQTTHTKLAIIDSYTVVVGSSNWRYYSLEKNNEANVIIYSEGVAQEYEEFFEEMWQDATQN